MAIIRWRDPFRIGVWPNFLPEEDLWQEQEQGLTVYETDNEVVVEANVAGVPAEEVDIAFEAGVLKIKAVYEETEEQKKKKKVVYREARKAQYFYTTSVPCPIKEDAIEAEVKDGVVKVSLPKKEAAKPRKIKVKAQSK